MQALLIFNIQKKGVTLITPFSTLIHETLIIQIGICKNSIQIYYIVFNSSIFDSDISPVVFSPTAAIIAA